MIFKSCRTDQFLYPSEPAYGCTSRPLQQGSKGLFSVMALFLFGGAFLVQTRHEPAYAGAATSPMPDCP